MTVFPSARSFNTLIKGYTRAGQLPVAFDVARRMYESRSTPPNQVTYNTLLHACVEQGQLGRARALYDDRSNYTRSSLMNEADLSKETVREMRALTLTLTLNLTLARVC